MSTYKALVGKKIKSVSSDPSDSIDGQMWYNSTTQSLRAVGVSQAWVSSGPLVQDYRSGGFAGATQSAFMIFGGYPVPTSNSKTFEYNGTGWTAGGNLGTGKYLNGGAGTLTAGLDYGGYNGSPPHTIPGGNITQEYDGSSWSNASAAMGTARYNCLGSGTQTAALSAGGISSPPANAPSANNNFSEEYNGSSWSEGNNLNTPRNVSGSQSGTQTAAIMFGGLAYPSSFKSDVENYDGTSWTSGTSLPAGRVRAGTSGTQTDALVYGGALPSVTDTCFSFDGTSFSSIPTLATARQSGGRPQNAPSTEAVFCGGGPSPKTGTEEFNSSTNVVTAAAWATGGSLSTARNSMFTGPIGTQTAGYAAGGATPGGRSNATEEYNGSSWTTVNTVPVSLSSRGGAGTQTAALAGGGYNPSPPILNVTVTEYYNGTAWTSQPSANPQTYGGASGGTQSATWMVSGLPPSTPKQAFEWDGSSWTAGNAYGTAKVLNLFGGGPQTAAWMCGGSEDPGLRTFTNHYDGTTWATAPNLGTARSGYCQGGTQAAGLVSGGTSTEPSTRTTAVEEFTGETTAANIQTFSTS